MDEMTGGAAPAAGASAGPAGPAVTSGGSATGGEGLTTGAVPGGTAVPQGDNGSTAPASGGQQTEELFEIVADKQTHKMTRAEVLRRAAMGIGAEARLREAAETKRKYAEMEARMAELDKMTPDDILRKRGMDPNAWAEERLAAALADSTLSPEAIQLREAQAKLSEFETRQQTEQRQKAEAERQGQIDRILQTRVAEVKQLFETDPYLGAKPEHFGSIVDETGQVLHAMHVEGEQTGDISLMNASTAQAYAFVRARRMSEARDMMAAFQDDGKLLEFMGDDFIGRIRKADAARLDSKARVAAPAAPLPRRPEEMTVSEMLEARALANKRG